MKGLQMVRPEGSWLLDKGDKGTGEQGSRSGRLWLRKGRHLIYIYKNKHNPLPIFLYNLKRKCSFRRKLSLLTLQKRFLFFSSRHHTLLFALQTCMFALRKAERGQFVHVCCCWNYGDFLIFLYKTRFLQTAAKSDDFFFFEVFAFNTPIIPILKHLSNWAHGIFPRDFTWLKVKYSVTFTVCRTEQFIRLCTDAARRWQWSVTNSQDVSWNFVDFIL